MDGCARCPAAINPHGLFNNSFDRTTLWSCGMANRSGTRTATSRTTIGTTLPRRVTGDPDSTAAATHTATKGATNTFVGCVRSAITNVTHAPTANNQARGRSFTASSDSPTTITVHGIDCDGSWQ